MFMLNNFHLFVLLVISLLITSPCSQTIKVIKSTGSGGGGSGRRGGNPSLRDSRGSEPHGCQLYKARTYCTNYHLISVPSFHGFLYTYVSTNRPMSLMCSQMLSALACANDLRDGCQDRDWMPFEIQRAVLEAICHDRKQDYEKGAKCFASQHLKMRIDQDCMHLLTRAHLQHQPCSIEKKITECAVKAAMAIHDWWCTSEDVDLMTDLLGRYLDSTVGILCNSWAQAQKSPTHKPTTSQPTTQTDEHMKNATFNAEPDAGPHAKVEDTKNETTFYKNGTVLGAHKLDYNTATKFKACGICCTLLIMLFVNMKIM